MRILIVLIVLMLGGCAALQKPAAPVAAPQVREFVGWAAVNGGGPQARANNTDWHLQNDLRLSEAGGRAKLHWRDGVAAGYSLELRHQSYPERKLQVLQLDVVEDSTGKTLTYVWVDESARVLGLNLGWLQVGLHFEPPTK
ncbi:MAG: hypothetical protein ABI846_01845 [Rudaea sp.]